MRFFLVSACLLLASASVSQAACTSADVVVYGGTPAGIAAAIQASRQKKDVILLEPTAHIGGMMASGLNKTDASPRKGVYGGIVAEFFKRASTHYKLTDPIRIYFESKWAEATMTSMLRGAGAKVVLNQRIQKLVRTTKAIKRIVMASGKEYCGDVFIDASYEGDLMALSGVSTIIGRESRAKYSESGAGVQLLERPAIGPSDSIKILVDPYVTPGVPSSGLLPGVIDIGQQPIGSADKSLMAFNYRFCVTKNRSNMVPFTKPADYDPLRYETTARFLQAVARAGASVTPNHFLGNGETVLGKYDVNSHEYFSTNVWHIGYRYVMADEAGRNVIRQQVRSHILGLLWFAQTDPRVPAKVRNYMTQFGLCADEFTDNGNFPRQMYVRQARRLVGQVVLTQNDLEKKTKFTDTIGLGYYTMDQHGMIRTVKDGYIADEVRKGISAGGPYEIPYRAMLPKKTQITNLLVPVALSTSHVAYTSVRVEPTYMVLGQAAGAAAALAKNGNVQEVDIPGLKRILSAAGQVMVWN